MTASPDTLDHKLEAVTACIRALGRVLVAFSGGVDSTLLLRLAVEALGAEQVVAAVGVSASLADRERVEAEALARAMGVELVTVETQELADPRYAENPPDRCYFCKVELFGRLTALARERRCAAVLAGANADDANDFRPGTRASVEHGIRSPLAEAGLTKREIRALSARFGLPTQDKPAMPCLASRLPYGEAVTPEKLRMIESAEAFLHAQGFAECRVRHHGPVARIEVPAHRIAELAAAECAARVEAHLRSLGYTYVCVDLRGLRSGSLNETIPLQVRSSSSSDSAES